MTKTLTRAAACATLTALLAGAVYAQNILRRSSSVSDEQINAMLTTRNDAEVNQYLSIGFRDVLTVVAPLLDKMPKDASSEFRFAKFNKKGEFTGIEKKTYPQYANPLGVITPPFGEDFDTSNRFYITSLAENAIETHEENLERMRSIGLRQGIDLEGYLRPFRLDTPLPKPESPIQQIYALVLEQPLGAIKEGMYFDRRSDQLGSPAARANFAFQMRGKQPLYCEVFLPYSTDSEGRHYLPNDTVVLCTFDGVKKRVLTSWDETNVELAKANGKPVKMVDGFCGAACSGTETSSVMGSGFPSDGSMGNRGFGGASNGSNFP